MNKKHVHVLIALLVITNLWAGVVPGRWDKVAKISEGTKLVVLLKDGSQVEGRSVEAGFETVTLETADGRRVKLVQNEVRRVLAPGRKDSVKNGALWGLIAGAGTGAVFSASVWGPWAHNEGADSTGISAFTIGFCGGIGTLIGLGADAAIRTRDGVLYEALP